MANIVQTHPTGRLDGRIAVITGAGRGLGLAYAEHLFELGARIAIVDLEATVAEAAARGIDATGETVRGYGFDVSDPAAVTQGFQAITEDLGPVDILLNNAGNVLIGLAPAEDISPEQWNKVIGVNLTGAWLCAREVIPSMKARGAGRIINVSSTTFSYGDPVHMVPYIASKGGIVGLTRALARELGPSGITVNAVAPGFTHQPEKKSTMTDEERARVGAAVMAQQSMKRELRAEDLVGAVGFLASDQSNMMTGQVMNVDGGWAFV